MLARFGIKQAQPLDLLLHPAQDEGLEQQVRLPQLRGVDAVRLRPEIEGAGEGLVPGGARPPFQRWEGASSMSADRTSPN